MSDNLRVLLHVGLFKGEFDRLRNVEFAKGKFYASCEKRDGHYLFTCDNQTEDDVHRIERYFIQNLMPYVIQVPLGVSNNSVCMLHWWNAGMWASETAIATLDGRIFVDLDAALKEGFPWLSGVPRPPSVHSLNDERRRLCESPTPFVKHNGVRVSIHPRSLPKCWSTPLELPEVKGPIFTAAGREVRGLYYQPLNGVGWRVTYPFKGSQIVKEKPLKTVSGLWSADGRYSVPSGSRAGCQDNLALPVRVMEKTNVAMGKPELAAWLASLPDEARVYVGDDGLDLRVVGDDKSYCEIGGYSGPYYVRFEDGSLSEPYLDIDDAETRQIADGGQVLCEDEVEEADNDGCR